MWFFIPTPRIRYRRGCRSEADSHANAAILLYFLVSCLICGAIQAVLRVCGVDTHHESGWLALIVVSIGFGVPGYVWWRIWRSLHPRQPRRSSTMARTPWRRQWEFSSPAADRQPPSPPPPPPSQQPFNRRMPKDRPYPWRTY